MPPPGRLARTVPLLLAVAVASCGGVEGKTLSRPRSDLPTVASVSGARFVTTVSLDKGELVVQPPGDAKPGVPLTSAETMFRAADAVQGTFDFSIVGLGIVTLSPPGSTPSTTEPPFPTTAVGADAAGAVPPSSPPTTDPPPTTTTAPGATTSSAPGGGPGSLPLYDARLSWVGVAWSPPCPGPGTDTTAGSTPEHPNGAARYTVVLFDARTGGDALAFTSGGPTSCGGPDQPPSLRVPAELVSVGWQPVGPASTAVQVSLPACGAYQGWTQLPSTGSGGGGIEVVALVPFDPTCATPATAETVDDVVPSGAAQAQVAHAPLGPIDAETTLPGGTT